MADPKQGSSVRAAIWLMHMSIPLLALWLLVANPTFDVAWSDHRAHLILVLATALLSLALGILIEREARARDDARLWYVSLVFVITSGFFAIHALATPGVLIQASHLEFMLPSRMGLVLAGAVALASSVEFTPERSERFRAMRRPLTITAYALMAACVAAIVLGYPDRLNRPELVGQVSEASAIVGGVLFALAGLALLPIYRRRRTVVVMSIITAYAFLSEASLTVAYGMAWHASWWLWHVLMTTAFCFIAYSAHVQFRRQGSARGLFDSLATQQTLADLRRDYAKALEAMVDVLARRERGESLPAGAVAAAVAERFGLSEQQLAVLNRGAEALGAERDQVRRLAGLIAVGQEASVVQDEESLLSRVLGALTEAFPGYGLRLGLVQAGELRFADGSVTSSALAAVQSLQPRVEERLAALPLVVKGRSAGVIEVRRPGGHFADAEVALLQSFASQISIALENARLYRNIDGLFRSYMSPSVATALLADPEQAGLGGAIAEVTVLMADLQGFTSYAETRPPDEIVGMLNTYYGAVVPVILETDGTVVQFVGDAVMAIWGAPARQPDHALYAARAGLALHRVVERAAAGRDWPRFRVGINTGPALVGNIGAEQFRTFTAIGDTTNLAARLESLAEPGQVVVGPETFQALSAVAQVGSTRTVHVKGRHEPVSIYVLRALIGEDQ